MATLEEQRDEVYEAAILVAEKAAILRNQRDLLLQALRFVLDDLNTALDFEARRIIEGAIASAEGLHRGGLRRSTARYGYPMLDSESVHAN